MFLQERQKKILEYINQHDKASTKELSRLFGISLVTIRSDINELDRKGLLLKTYGGALSLMEKMDFELPTFIKNMRNVGIKKQVGETAADMIKDDDVVIFDSGTTTLQIAMALTKKNITGITNDLQIAYVLVGKGIPLIMTGGSVIANTQTLTGLETINFLNKMRANKLFLGVDAIDFKDGITNRTLIEAGVKRAMIKASKTVIAVFDHSKCGKKVFAKVCDISELDTVVTDQLTDEEKACLDQAGVRWVLAGKKTDENE